MEGQHLRVFVAGGTWKPFVRLLRLVKPLTQAANVELFVQRGEGAEEFAALPGAPSISREAYAARLAWADVVVCHGGAGTLYEAVAAGHKPLALARRAAFGEANNDHQADLIDALERRGMALAMPESGVTRTLLEELARARRRDGSGLHATALSEHLARSLVDPARATHSVRERALVLARMSMQALERAGRALEHGRRQRKI